MILGRRRFRRLCGVAEQAPSSPFEEFASSIRAGSPRHRKKYDHHAPMFIWQCQGGWFSLALEWRHFRLLFSVFLLRGTIRIISSILSHHTRS